MTPSGHRLEDGWQKGIIDEKPVYYNKKVVDSLSDAARTSDALSLVISKGEQWAANSLYAFAGVVCVTDAPLCIPAAKTAFLADATIATLGGGVENSLGWGSLFATAIADLLQGYTTYSANQLFIGRDTIVSARNAALGTVPFCNLDAWVSESQLAYDLARKEGKIPGGTITVSNERELALQLAWENSPWKDSWNTIITFFGKE